MEVELLLLVFLLAGSCGKTLYLVDLYTCVDEFEDYCHKIPQWAVRAAIGLANHCDDILPGYTLSSLNKSFRPKESRSLLQDGEVILTASILRGFNNEVLPKLFTNSTTGISPILLGSPFSFVSEYAVHILGEKQNYIQVNFRSTLANLSNSPFFYRIGPNEAFFHAIGLKLLIKNNWRRVGILSSSGKSSVTAEELERQLVKANITVVNTASFVIQGKINDTVWNVGQLAELKDEDVRIVIALLPMIEVPLIMCAAHDIGLIDDHHVWILPEMNLNDIRRVAKQYNMCDVDIVLRNALMVAENYYNRQNHSLPFGTNSLDDLLIKYNNLSSMRAASLREIPGYNLSRVVFDATWAVILGLNNSIQPLAESGWTLVDLATERGVNGTFSSIINNSLSQVNFSGLSGMVDFSNRSSNILGQGTFDTARVLQIINNSSCTVDMYMHNNETGLIPITDPSFCSYTWGNDPPTADGLIYHPQVPAALLIFTIVATVIFISVAMALIVFTVALRKHRYMKTSSVSFNIMIIVGCILVFTIPIPVLLTYGAVQYHINEAGFSALCHAYCFLDKIGFILVSIALLLKTWRLYQIKRNKLLKMKIRFISRKEMFIITVILLLPVVILMLIQLIIDRPKLNSYQMEIEDGYPYKYIEYTYCDQTWDMVWETTYVCYNIAIVVCIFWQASHVSQMKFKQLAFEGDTSVRLLLALVTVTFCHILVIMIFLFAGNFYLVVVIHILGSMTFPMITIAMIFLPKIWMITKDYQLVTGIREVVRRKSSGIFSISSSLPSEGTEA